MQCSLRKGEKKPSQALMKVRPMLYKRPTKASPGLGEPLMGH